MQLRVLSPKKNLTGKRVFLRVDWNVPLGSLSASSDFRGEESLKISRSIKTIKKLAKRGAIVLVATHIGRPKKREEALSTQHLLPLVTTRYDLPLHFLGDVLDTQSGLTAAQERLRAAPPGRIYLLENVRLYPGEVKNDPKLARAFASLADLFINDAFASCHPTKHASVFGIAKQLPSYAGPELVSEIAALERLGIKPGRPYIAIIGGAKISTKVDVLVALLHLADQVFIGGAMANVFFAARGLEIGKSFVEKEGIMIARKLLKNKKIILPRDVVVAKKLAIGISARAIDVTSVRKTDVIGDIGPETMRAWSQEIKMAQTILWNGPLGAAEIPAFSHGSLVIARTIAARSKGPAYGIVGGGDTLPIAFATGMSEWYDHLSTGGGAMLEFIAKKGRLPGIDALKKLDKT